ncbi:MAG: chromosome segregation protein [Oceanotoga sp.]|jgi:chromosome segregation protein|uniref:chromosome segregation protein SMC n=1 Tax=Oceanotoga sp. TaxID=2108366 RepID=UPI00264E8C2F|nr:chromosome segregation protein SMC [Oceanotoga sp.]MDN5343227.1 chromosome segregation protein [Oceanotoga sp.]
MKLKTLEIEGFKSFAKKTSIDINKNLIAIVGPNGSGKSNVVDAIRWMLGEQSNKQMRIQDREDVVFSGTNKHKPSKFAMVSLIIEIDEKNIKLTKYFDKNKGNIYSINDKNSTLKDILNLFSNGIGKQFYSIISQGQVSDIVNSSSEQLKNIIIDASEIKDFLDKKNYSLKLLEKTQENLDRINDILYMTEKRLKSLSIRAGRAKKYLENKQQLQNIGKIYFGASKIYKMNTIDTLEKEKHNISLDLKKLYSEQFDIERKYRSLKEEIDNVEDEINKNTDLIESYRSRTSSLEKEKERLNESINELNSEILSIDWKINNFDERLKNEEQKLEEVSTLEKTYNIDFERIYNEYEEILSKKNDLENTVSQKQKLYNEKKFFYNTLIDEINKNNTLIEQKNNSIIGKKERLEFLKTEFENKSNKIESIELSLKKIRKKLTIKSEEEKSLINAIKEKITALKDLNSEYNVLKNDLENRKSERIQLKNKLENLNLQISEYAGYSSVIKEFFKEFKDDDNVVDVVANIVEINEQYEEAISSSAGYKLQNIVIKSSSYSKFYIDFLKKLRMGKITFLPLDLLKTKSYLNKKFLNEPGVIDYLINIIKFDNKYQKIMEYVFSNTILVNDIESAINLSKVGFNSNIVTINGETVSGQGSISAGKNKYDYSSSILKRKRELQETIFLLEENKENIIYSESEIKKISEKIIKLNDIVREEKEKLNDLISEKNIHNNEFKSLNEELKNLISSNKNISERIYNYEDEIEILKEDIINFQKINSENKNKTLNLKKEIETLEIENSDFNLKITELKQTLLEKKYQKDSLDEKINYYNQKKVESLKNIDHIKSEKIDLNEKYSNIKNTLESKNNDIKRVEIEYDSLNTEITKIFDIMKSSRSGKFEKAEDLEILETEKNNLKELINEKKERNNSINYEIENVKHEIEFLTEKANNLDIEASEFELVELDEIELKSYSNKIKEIEDYLKNLGSVDLTVLDEFNEVENEFNTQNMEKEDIVESYNKLKNSINDLDSNAEKIYGDFFEKLNEKFKIYISQLFINGYGELRLVGEGKIFEQGIQISVKKSGRNFQKLSLFSGGEKALIAIAFLFSLMDLNPSPFYILDEIDAPLDDINADKIASLIKNNAHKSQFMIITHNKLMMEIAEIFHGITMKNGVTYVVPVDFKEFSNIS